MKKENQCILFRPLIGVGNTIAMTNVAANSNDKTSFILDNDDVAHVSYFAFLVQLKSIMKSNSETIGNLLLLTQL